MDEVSQKKFDALSRHPRPISTLWRASGGPSLDNAALGIMTPASRTGDGVAGNYAVVAAVGVGQQDLRVILQKLFRPVAPSVEREVEHVVGMIRVAYIDPHPRPLGLARAQHWQDGVVGSHHMRSEEHTSELQSRFDLV